MEGRGGKCEYEYRKGNKKVKDGVDGGRQKHEQTERENS